MRKKTNFVPIHKEIDKQYVENNRPVSVLAICSKVFECIIYNNTMYPYFFKKQNYTKNQSGFKLSNCCENQLLASTPEKSFQLS